jgi:hypothetical protein
VKKTSKMLIVGASVLAIGGGAAGAAIGNSSGNSAGPSNSAEPSGAAEPNEAAQHVSGSGADQATAAALKITHGGHANAVERDSENGATWEVEVTKPDGKTVDVRLDQNYQLVVVEGDSEAN